MANSNPEVRLTVLPQNLFEYYTYVFETHCKQGLDPEELIIASELWKRLKASPKIDFSDLGKVKMENLSPTQVAVSLEHEGGVCTPAEAVIES